MSCSAKPSSFDVAATSRRAGNCLAANVVIADCIMSSVIIRPFSFGHTDSTSYPVRPATRPALRAGQVVRPCRVPISGWSQTPLNFGLLSASRWRIFDAAFFVQHPCYQGQAGPLHHARKCRASYISKITITGMANINLDGY